METRRTNRKYDRVFKEEAAKLANVSSVARELGIDYRTLRRWCGEYEQLKGWSFQGSGTIPNTVNHKAFYMCRFLRLIRHECLVLQCFLVPKQ